MQDWTLILNEICLINCQKHNCLKVLKIQKLWKTNKVFNLSLFGIGLIDTCIAGTCIMFIDTYVSLHRAIILCLTLNYQKTADSNTDLFSRIYCQKPCEFRNQMQKSRKIFNFEIIQCLWTETMIVFEWYFQVKSTHIWNNFQME